MREVFQTVLSLTVSGSLLILFLYLIWPFLAKGMSKYWLYYIWLIVVVRLLVPFSPEVSIVGIIVTQVQEYSLSKVQNSSLGQMDENQVQEEKQANEETWGKEAAETQGEKTVVKGEEIKDEMTAVKEAEIKGEKAASKEAEIEDEITAVKEAETKSEKTAIKEAEEKEALGLRKREQVIYTYMRNVWQNLWIIWIMTALLLWIRKITIYQSFVKYIHAGWEEVEDLHQLELLGKLVEQSRIRGMVRLYTNPLVSSPLLLGFYRPCVVLPSVKISDSDFYYTILHELSHYKRGDMFYKWLVQLTICVHWFNPLVYKMGNQINQLCELACDEAVIQAFDSDEKRAYGATLLHAAESKGRYKETISSLTLSESMERLRERLDAIMSYKKRNRYTQTVSIMLTMLLCFGAFSAGAYAGPKQNGGKEQESIAKQETTTADNLTRDVSPGSSTTASSSAEEAATTTNAAGETEIPSVLKSDMQEKAKSSTANKSRQFQQEYTIAELKELDISGVIAEVSSEHITIVRGGSTLKFEADTSSSKAYQIQREDDGGKTRYNLCLTASSSAAAKAGQTITITIPEKLDLKVIKAVTKSGTITFTNCSASLFLGAETKSGRIQIEGGRADCYLDVSTKSGNAWIAGVQLPGKNQDGYLVNFQTVSGSIVYQPIDGAKNECYIIDAGKQSQIEVNGQKYAGGDYTIHSTMLRRIYFDSTKGSFLVQDQSLGKYKYTAVSEPTRYQAEAAGRSDRKTYSLADLKRLGITGLRVEAVRENIVVKQGGNALVIQYQQPKNAKTIFRTHIYELYNGEFTKPEEIALFGGRSGSMKQLLLRREKSESLEGTITVTLPADPKYSRVVQLFTKSGDISFKQCTSTSMLDATTTSGTITADKCSSPILGVKSTSGDIQISQCRMQQLNAQTTSGSCNLELEDKASAYKMILDTGKEAGIQINGKKYPGGEWKLYPNAAKEILFDTRSGTLRITDV